jgi:8-oxo-dGTP pyrophosphatase MutT (NUDIX family)
MPPVSEKQRRAMYAAAEGKSTLGIPQKIGKEFIGKDAEPRAAAGVMITAPDGRTLFLRRSDDGDHPGEWCFPGGGIEDGETPEAAARREVREETGHQIDGGVAPIDYLHLRHEGVDFTTFRHSVPERFVPRLNGEHSEYAWVHSSNPPQPLHPGVAATLKKLNGEKAETMPAAQDCYALDRADTARRIDADGRLHVASTPISKANVCEYIGHEIPNWESLGLDANRRYKLWRHPDELKKAAKTFNNLQVLARHVPVNASDHQPAIVIGSTGTDAAFKHPYLSNSMVIWAKDAIDDIDEEIKKELSSAYRYRADMTPGTTPEGADYDGIMRDIVGNHVALVREGRAGPDVVVADGADEAAWQMLGRVLNQALFQGALDVDWKEDAHPRADNGQFGKGSGGGKKAAVETQKAREVPKALKEPKAKPAKEPKPKAATKPKATVAPKPGKTEKPATPPSVRDQADLVAFRVDRELTAAYRSGKFDGTAKGAIPVMQQLLGQHGIKVTKKELAGVTTKTQVASIVEEKLGQHHMSPVKEPKPKAAAEAKPKAPKKPSRAERLRSLEIGENLLRRVDEVHKSLGATPGQKARQDATRKELAAERAELEKAKPASPKAQTAAKPDKQPKEPKVAKPKAEAKTVKPKSEKKPTRSDRARALEIGETLLKRRDEVYRAEGATEEDIARQEAKRRVLAAVRAELEKPKTAPKPKAPAANAAPKAKQVK